MFKFPYTSYQKINLDWIMKTLNQLKEAIPLVQQASTVYNQALEALADAEAAVETVTEQAAAAVTTANAANATAAQANTTAAQANTTAAQANQTAVYADTEARAALANAGTALTTAQGASSAASAAQGSADTALGKATLVYKGETYFPANVTGIMNPTPQVSIPLSSFSEKIVILYCSDYKSTFGSYAAWNSTEIPKDVLEALVADFVTIPCVTGYYGTPDKGMVDCYFRISVQNENVIVEAWNARYSREWPRYARVYAS